MQDVYIVQCRTSLDHRGSEEGAEKQAAGEVELSFQVDDVLEQYDLSLSGRFPGEEDYTL